jgi:hypothetical protein
MDWAIWYGAVIVHSLPHLQRPLTVYRVTTSLTKYVRDVYVHDVLWYEADKDSCIPL